MPEAQQDLDLSQSSLAVCLVLKRTDFLYSNSNFVDVIISRTRRESIISITKNIKFIQFTKKVNVNSFNTGMVHFVSIYFYQMGRGDSDTSFSLVKWQNTAVLSPAYLGLYSHWLSQLTWSLWFVGPAQREGIWYLCSLSACATTKSEVFSICCNHHKFEKVHLELSHSLWRAENPSEIIS